MAFSSCMSNYQSLTPDQFQTAMTRPGVTVVDVRTPEEFAAGHIPGATNINLQQSHFTREAKQQLTKNQEVLVNCKGGVRSKTAAKKLSRKGYQVSELDKGFNEWKNQGKPVTPAEPVKTQATQGTSHGGRR